MSRGLRRKVLEAARALATRELSIEFERVPIGFSRVPYRKIVNWLAVEAGIALRREEPWGRPTHVQVEPSSRCNLRCTYCPVGTESGETGHMSAELFTRFVDEVHRHALIVALWGWGEPFVCPSVYDMIAHAHARGLRVVSSTNGHLFVRPAHAAGVVRSGLDVLIVSLSGTRQDTYERFRSGKLETALDGVRAIVAEKRRRGVRTPHVQLSFIVTEWSEGDVPGLLDLARELGVDGVSLKKMNTATVRPVAGGDEPVPRDEALRRFRYGDDRERKRVTVNPCKALWHNPTLRWDGRINPCVYDFDGAHDLGDASREPFARIWRGDRYRELRARFRRDWESIPICDRCTYAYEGGSYTDVVADAWFFDSGGRVLAPGAARPVGRA